MLGGDYVWRISRLFEADEPEGATVDEWEG